jgi:hypothetical protein
VIMSKSLLLVLLARPPMSWRGSMLKREEGELPVCGDREG